jgi:hypothetical protein
LETKGKYNSWAEQASLPFFMQTWWLDAVCGAENWQPVLAFDGKNEIEGAIIVYEKRKFGIKIVTQPILTPYSGIYLKKANSTQKSYDITQKEVEILEKLIAQLPKRLYFLQQYHFSLTQHLPFHWAGFRQTTRYTHILDLSESFDTIFQRARHDTRKNFNKASRNVEISTSDNAILAYPFITMTANRHAKAPYTLVAFEKVFAAAKAQKQGEIYLAKDESGAIHAAAFVVWDSTTCYFLASGMDISKPSAAISGIIWRAIADAKNRGTQYFDFDGSMLPNVENVTRGFGGERKAYSRITKGILLI